ncbi:hypothetical protein ACWD6Z_32455, partial [Streptomyces californicus]
EDLAHGIVYDELQTIASAALKLPHGARRLRRFPEGADRGARGRDRRRAESPEVRADRALG